MIQSSYSLAFNGKALLNNSKEMLWNRNIFTVTTSTDGHGSLTASPMSGFSGTNVSLSNTPNPNYSFTGYSVTGATLTGNQFTLNNDVTAKAEFAANAIDYYSNPQGINAYTNQHTRIFVNIPFQTNYTVVKYDSRYHQNPSTDARLFNKLIVNAYSEEARMRETQYGVYTHDFSATPTNTITCTTGMPPNSWKFIIDRSARRWSGYIDGNYDGGSDITFRYRTGSKTGATAMAQADDVSGLVAIEWYPFGGRMEQYITNIKVGGTTSFAKAIQY